MELKIGDEWPAWWETNDGRPAGEHMAKILSIEPYTGAYPQHFSHVLTLAAPTTKRGSTEMAVDDHGETSDTHP